MAYERFTIEQIEKDFGLQIVYNLSLSAETPAIDPPEILATVLARYGSLGSTIGTEKARSEYIIAPILAELREISNQTINVFSGIKFDVDAAKGLRLL